jgi:hypothetical protein
MSYLRKQVSIGFYQINFKMDSRFRGNDKRTRYLFFSSALVTIQYTKPMTRIAAMRE